MDIQIVYNEYKFNEYMKTIKIIIIEIMFQSVVNDTKKAFLLRH